MSGRPWLTWRGNGRPPPASEQHAAARFWASHGLPVCRLIAGDKRPTDKAPKTTGANSQHRLASVDLDVIDLWWQEVHPYWGARALCNPGLPTGPWPGFLALDVDHPEAFEAWVAGRALPETLTWSSCRPDHPERYTLLFRYPRVGFPVRSVVNGNPRCVPGVDLRADAEHVVLPGAIHTRGSVYTIRRNALAVAPPVWLVAELTERFGRVPTSTPRAGVPAPRRGHLDVSESQRQVAYSNALRLFARAVDSAREAHGQRHRVLVGLAWEGLARGLRADDVRCAVLRYVSRACPDHRDRSAALRQLDEALEQPRACEPNNPRFTVAAQELRMHGLVRTDGPSCGRPGIGRE